MAELESVTATLGELFEPASFYRIPAYQRPFSWEDDHFDDLVSDTRDADRRTPYFLGTMVLHKEDTGTLAVVDGQQRLTAVLILLACLRDAIDDERFKAELQDKILQKEKVVDKIPERVRLEVKDREMFQRLVVRTGGTLETYDLREFTAPEARYVRAATSFHSHIEGMSQEERKEYVTFLSGKCVVVYLLADNFEQAFRLFEIVNDRGKQLRRIDVLKSINIAPDVIAQDAVRERVAQRWEAVETQIGEEIFENIFYLVRLILLKDKPQGDLLREFERRIFQKKLQKGENFTNLIFEYADLYQEIFVDKTYIHTDDKFGIKYQSLIHIMDAEFKASEWRACVLSFAKKFGRDSFYQFCLAIEKLFLSHWVKGVRKDERYGDYVRLLVEIEDSNDPDKVIAAVPKDNDAIIKAATKTDVYSSGYCKYFLLRLELVTSEHDVPKFYSARSIEHVFPQTPKEGSKWREWAGERALETLVGRIGNLVLISKSRNSSASNLEFDEKKKRYLKPRVSDYPRSVQVLGYDRWTPDTIDERTDQVAKELLEDL